MALGAWQVSQNQTNNVTVAAGTSRVAFCFVELRYNTVPTSVTVTVGGVAMTSAGAPVPSVDSAPLVAVWGFYLLDADFPADGAQSRVVTITGGSGVTGRLIAYIEATERAQEAPQWDSDGVSSDTLALGPLDTLPDAYGLSAVLTTNDAATFTAGGSWATDFDQDGSTGDSQGAGGSITYAADSTDTVTWTCSASGRVAGSFAVLNPLAAPTGPTINQHPQNATAIDGSTVQFSVDAEGEGSLTYQWMVDTGSGFSAVTDGSGGATATYTAPTVHPAMGTWNWRCDITDDNGTVESNPATLTVLTGTTHILLFRAP